MKKIILAIACLGLAGGVASADRYHGGNGGHGPVVHNGGGERGGGRVEVRDHRYEGGVHVTAGARSAGYNRGYNREYNRGGYDRGYNRPVYNAGYRYDRRPIYMQRPVIRERYYDYRYRPQLIVENYGPRDGYYWVAGQWTWDGYEWQWQPGHYEPDANYGVSAGVYLNGGY